MYSRIEESLTRIQESLLNQQRNFTRSSSDVEPYSKDFKKVKSSIDKHRQTFNQEQKQSISAQQSRITTLFNKLKPAQVLLKLQEKAQYREKILNCLKTIEKKLTILSQKKDNKKENKKRQTYIEYFKFHIAKLSKLSQLLLSPTKSFTQEHMKSLGKYLNDIHISQDDSVFQDDLKQVYEKIFTFGEEPKGTIQQLFLGSYSNLPKFNDYLPPTQTKENCYRSSICPTYKMIDLSILPKMSKQLLFFIFFSQKGQTQQYLAARELMKRGWRYNIRFQIWIKRCAFPSIDTMEDFETGNYYTMGPDLSMRQRKNIKIHRKHLINDL